MLARESELKFCCENYDVVGVLNSLQRLCRQDGQYSVNIVNSVYFDTHDWLFAMEKASSDYLKTKVRVRWYQSVTSKEMSNCFLELKNKIGSKRHKVRLPLAINGGDIIQHLSSSVVTGAVSRLVAEHMPELAGLDLLPRIKVSYHRQRFIDPLSSTRVALDTKITGYGVVSSSAYEAYKVSLGRSVIEVKGHAEELPTTLRYMQAANFKKAAFSKYYECFQLLTGYQQ